MARRRQTGVALVALSLLTACFEMPREAVTTLTDRGYPTCGDGAAAASVEPVQRELRAGPVMTEQSVVETFSLASDGCRVRYTGHEEWAMGSVDLEIVFDADRRPLRAYRRSTAPGPHPAPARTDVRVYELRGPHVELWRRQPLGEIERLLYRAASPG